KRSFGEANQDFFSIVPCPNAVVGRPACKRARLGEDNGVLCPMGRGRVGGSPGGRVRSERGVSGNG
ncbi:MAG: hypothetical protein ACK56I_04940, partial [bacterium]